MAIDKLCELLALSSTAVVALSLLRAAFVGADIASARGALAVDALGMVCTVVLLLSARYSASLRAAALVLAVAAGCVAATAHGLVDIALAGAHIVVAVCTLAVPAIVRRRDPDAAPLPLPLADPERLLCGVHMVVLAIVILVVAELGTPRLWLLALLAASVLYAHAAAILYGGTAPLPHGGDGLIALAFRAGRQLREMRLLVGAKRSAVAEGAFRVASAVLGASTVAEIVVPYVCGAPSTLCEQAPDLYTRGGVVQVLALAASALLCFFYAVR